MSDRPTVLFLLLTVAVSAATGSVATAMMIESPKPNTTQTQPAISPSTPPSPDTRTDVQPYPSTQQSSQTRLQPDQSTPASSNISVTVHRNSYAELYNRTIDSVVTVRVVTARGTSQGSGFVYDSAGHIVTNEHVVGPAEQVMVRFSDGTWHTATVIGTDIYTDLAVLSVESMPAYIDPLPVAASNPRPGQPVAALGSPLGLEGSITTGVVSGVNRSMDTARGFSIPATVQTDAPINPGNSGGPLVTLNGTVVGVNRAKQGDNIGFAISPQLIEQVVPALIANGTYEHPYMGVQTVPVTPLVAEANGLTRARGVMIVNVVEGGPSVGHFNPARSHAQVNGQVVPTGGDIILRVDGAQITSQQQLARYLMLHTHPGERVSVTILRDGDQETISLTLGERPDPTADYPG